MDDRVMKGRVLMNGMNRINIAAVASLCLAGVFPSANAMAQDKQRVSFSTPAENTKYTEKTENLDIGDVPTHVLGVFEIHRVYPNNAPVINGSKMVESWTRGTGDRIDGTGTNAQYVTFMMENGDKVFARMEGFAMNDSGKVHVNIAGRITGGTGKLATIQGFVKEVVDLDKDTNVNRTEIEYSVGK
jgi:hypothetical protein